MNSIKQTTSAKIHLPLLCLGIIIMLIGSIFPWIFADANGHAHHGIAMVLFWAMSASIVRGVGFIPNNNIARWLFSGWATLLGLSIAVFLRFFVR